jgi:hypothetical protein
LAGGTVTMRRLVDEFDSTVMRIEIRGATILYAYKGRPDKVYRIDDVNLFDLSKLKQTNRNSDFSSGATVAYLTHIYPGSHYGPDGLIAPPARESKGRLLKKTPYRSPR